MSGCNQNCNQGRACDCDMTERNAMNGDSRRVPVEPTGAMIDAAERLDWTNEDVRAQVINQWHAMLSAAPAVERGEAVAWVACGVVDGEVVALPEYSGQTVNEVQRKVLERAAKEGWHGSVGDRLYQLGWKIRPVFFTRPAESEALLSEARSVIKSLDAIISGECFRDWSEHFGKDWEDMERCLSRIDAHLKGRT